VLHERQANWEKKEAEKAETERKKLKRWGKKTPQKRKSTESPDNVATASPESSESPPS